MTLSVLHIITDLSSAGAERALGRLVLAAQKQKTSHHVVISLASQGVVGDELKKAGIEVHFLNMCGILSLPQAVLRLVGHMRRIQPDVVMTWLYHADLMGSLGALLAGRPPVIWNLRCSDIDFSHYAPTTRWTVWILARLSWLPYAIIANSEAGRKSHTALGYCPKRWFYIPNGFNPSIWFPDANDRQAVRRKWGLAEGELAVGLVARVDPQKDHATFLKAAAQVAAHSAKVRFVLIGAGTQKLSIPNDLSNRVLVLGEQREIPRLLRGLDMAVLSSSSEGFPNVIGEAMATGVPCAVTDVGDASRLVGETGRVAPPRNPEALAEAIKALLNEPEPVRQERGQQARDRIMKNYHLDQVLARFETIWQLALAKTSPSSIGALKTS